MTVAVDDRRREHPGNGVATVLTGPRAFKASHVSVYEIDDTTLDVVSLAGGFTLTGVGGRAQTVVTLAVPTPVGKTCLVLRTVPYEQDTDITNQGSFLPEVVEGMGDALAMQVQQIADGLSRTIRASDTSVGIEPIPLEPNRYIVTDVNGNPALSDSPPVADLTLRANLAASAGAGLVGFLQSGTGAVARTVQDKLRDVVSVKDFGAVGDGVADDTAALQAALDRIGVLGGGTLTLPDGEYLISATLVVYDNTAIIGSGWSVTFNGSVQAPTGTIIRLAAGSDCDMFRQFDASKRYSLYFKDFCLDGDGANQTSNMGPDGPTSIYQFNRNGFYFTALYNTRWVNVRCQNMRGSGWVINGDAITLCTNFFLEYCSAYNCRVYCVNFRGSATDGHVNFGDYGFGRCGGISLDSPSHSLRLPIVWTSQCQDITDPATHASGTGAVSDAAGGIRVNGANCRIIAPTSEGHAGHGIKVTVNGDSCEIRDPTIYFVSATAGTSGLFDGINADAVDDLKIFDPVVKNSGSATTTIRYAIELDAAHTRARIMGGDLRRLGASAAEVTTPVVIGLKSGDKSDYAWAISDVDVWQNTLQAIAGAFTVVPFQVENTDAVGEWASNTFTAAEYGFYRVETGVAFSPADGAQGSISVFKNGAELKRLSSYRAGSAGTAILPGSLTVELAAGDTMDVRGFCSVATNTVVGQTVTWLRIRQVSR